MDNGYLDWRFRQKCKHCGAKAMDRPQMYGLDGGHWWLTETDCGCKAPKFRKAMEGHSNG